MAQQRYYGRQRAYSGFTAEIEDFVRETEDRMMRVIKGSLQDLVDNAQTPVREGGRMRVDTGFLRASGRASIGGWPSGPSVKPVNAAPNSFSYDGEAVSAVLLDLKMGDTFHFGWTANYAEYRELYDGFLESSVQNWARYVAWNADTLRQRIK